MEAMKELIAYIRQVHSLQAVPAKIINEKRWASDDRLFESGPLSGVPCRVRLSTERGVILYDWDPIPHAVILDIRERFSELTQ